MLEPTSSAGAAVVTGVASGLTLSALGVRPEIGVLSGVFCGAMLFLLRSKEPSWLKKILYFCISLVGGYAITPAVSAAVAWMPAWLAAFISAASVVGVAVIVLDWLETALPQILNRLVERIIGRDRHE